jgi:hypothetical protein
MHLKNELILPQARIVKVKIALGTEEHRVTLEIKTALTHEVAEAFGCRDIIYAGDVPRSGVEKISLEGSELNCYVHLKHDSFAFGTVVEEMTKYVAKLEGTGPELHFHIKFKGYVITVADLIEHVRIDPIEITLKPAQLPLELHEPAPCVDCENDIPFADGDPSHHASGQACARYKAPEEAVDGAPLAAAAVMGGTHQKGTKGRRKSTPEPVSDEEFADGFDVPEVVQ